MKKIKLYKKVIILGLFISACATSNNQKNFLGLLEDKAINRKNYNNTEICSYSYIVNDKKDNYKLLKQNLDTVLRNKKNTIFELDNGEVGKIKDVGFCERWFNKAIGWLFYEPWIKDYAFNDDLTKKLVYIDENPVLTYDEIKIQEDRKLESAENTDNNNTSDTTPQKTNIKIIKEKKSKDDKKKNKKHNEKINNDKQKIKNNNNNKLKIVPKIEKDQDKRAFIDVISKKSYIDYNTYLEDLKKYEKSINLILEDPKISEFNISFPNNFSIYIKKLGPNNYIFAIKLLNTDFSDLNRTKRQILTLDQSKKQYKFGLNNYFKTPIYNPIVNNIKLQRSIEAPEFFKKTKEKEIKNNNNNKLKIVPKIEKDQDKRAFIDMIDFLGKYGVSLIYLLNNPQFGVCNISNANKSFSIYINKKSNSLTFNLNYNKDSQLSINNLKGQTLTLDNTYNNNYQIDKPEYNNVYKPNEFKLLKRLSENKKSLQLGLLANNNNVISKKSYILIPDEDNLENANNKLELMNNNNSRHYLNWNKEKLKQEIIFPNVYVKLNDEAKLESKEWYEMKDSIYSFYPNELGEYFESIDSFLKDPLPNDYQQWENNKGKDIRSKIIRLKDRLLGKKNNYINKNLKQILRDIFKKQRIKNILSKENWNKLNSKEKYYYCRAASAAICHISTSNIIHEKGKNILKYSQNNLKRRMEKIYVRKDINIEDILKKRRKKNEQNNTTVLIKLRKDLKINEIIKNYSHQYAFSSNINNLTKFMQELYNLEVKYHKSYDYFSYN